MRNEQDSVSEEMKRLVPMPRDWHYEVFPYNAGRKAGTRVA